MNNSTKTQTIKVPLPAKLTYQDLIRGGKHTSNASGFCNIVIPQKGAVVLTKAIIKE